MAQIAGRFKINVEFHLTSEEQLHVFAQWREQNTDVKLEDMNARKYQAAIREVLAALGWQAVTAKLPEKVEIKKIDYKAILKGIIV
jgi:hypothetical protein